jgi:hypothetical protein
MKKITRNLFSLDSAFKYLYVLCILASCNQEEQNLNEVPTLNTESETRAFPSELSVYYQGYSDGQTYTQNNATADLKSLKFWDSNATLSIKQYDNTNGYKGLRVKMGKDLYQSTSGVIAETYLADRNEYTLEYKVFFEPGFEFNRGNNGSIYGGGKLPGLTGGSRPGGCTKKTDGMSARIMFRRDPTRSNPYLELYQYWRNQTGDCGEQVYLQDVQAGVWYTIKIKVNLGSSTADGNVKVWVNGTQKLSKNYRYLASGQSWKLNGMMFHSFMGGNTSSWAPTEDRYLIIDNYKVDDNAF